MEWKSKKKLFNFITSAVKRDRGGGTLTASGNTEVSPFVTIKNLNFSDMTAHILGSHSAKLGVVIIRHTDIFASNISTLPRKVFTHEGVTLLKWNQTDTAHTKW